MIHSTSSFLGVYRITLINSLLKNNTPLCLTVAIMWFKQENTLNIQKVKIWKDILTKRAEAGGVFEQTTIRFSSCRWWCQRCIPNWSLTSTGKTRAYCSQFCSNFRDFDRSI